MIDKNLNMDRFCVVPFVQLNTRGKGDARVCCSIDGLNYGIPKELTLDQVNDDTYNGKTTPVFNLQYDDISDLWNSDFMRDFRMKMLNGEYIPNCEFCYRMENSGLSSKRLGKNKIFLEKAMPFLQDYFEKQGYVDKMPQWWEIRLSTKCNLSCIMCAPSLSTMMYKEYAQWKKKGIGSQYTNGALAIAQDSGEEFLSKSKFFRDQVTSNLQHVLYMEFRGGEVFADKESIDFIEAISETEYAAGITLDISTNATLLTDRVINILNKFKGGKLRLSIDAYKEEDEWIRYHTEWDAVMSSMDTMDNLHSDWMFLTQTTVQFLNCLTLDRLVEFFNDYIIKKQDKRFFLGFTSVRGKDWLRHEMVPNYLREQAVEKLKKLKQELPIFQSEWPTSPRLLIGIDQLIAVLSDEEYKDDYKKELAPKAQNFFETLTRVRQADYFERFPHIIESLGEHYERS